MFCRVEAHVPKAQRRYFLHVSGYSMMGRYTHSGSHETIETSALVLPVPEILVSGQNHKNVPAVRNTWLVVSTPHPKNNNEIGHLSQERVNIQILETPSRCNQKMGQIIFCEVSWWEEGRSK